MPDHTLFMVRLLPQHLGFETERLKDLELSPSPRIVDGQVKDRVHGHIGPEKLREIDGEWYNRELLLFDTGFHERGSDQGISFKIGERIRLGITPFRVGRIMPRELRIGVRYADNEVVAARLARENVRKMIVVQDLETTMYDTGFGHHEAR